MSKEEKNGYTIQSDENLGEIKIADEVVSIIAGLPVSSWKVPSLTKISSLRPPKLTEYLP